VVGDELRIMNVWFGMSGADICPLIESEEVVGVRATDGICGRIE
jgi:hypothetical protein